MLVAAQGQGYWGYRRKRQQINGRPNEAGLVPTRAVVRFPGGDLEIERQVDGEVLLSGDAQRVFEGVVDVEALMGS